jgi:hypothetical protein
LNEAITSVLGNPVENHNPFLEKPQSFAKSGRSLMMRGALMLRYLPVVAALLSLGVANAQAADSAEVRLAYNYLSRDMTTCTVFYMLSARCLGNDNQEFSEQIDKAASMMANLAALTGKHAGLKDDALVALTNAQMAKMEAQNGRDCANIAALLKRYGESCKALGKHPQAAFEQVLTRVNAEKPQ